MFCAGFFHTRKNLKNFSKEVIKSHLAVLIWCGKRDKHFSNHKGKEVRLMKPSDFQKTVQCRFESCLKKVVRSVVKDYYKELNGSNGRTAEGGTDKVRTDEEEVLTGAQERSIYGTSSEREAEGTLVDDTGAGRGENGASDQTDEGERGDTGKGFEFDGNPVSLWFDEMGMRIGYGTSAKENTLAVMGWSEVESHIRVMVENGTYMSANEVFLGVDRLFVDESHNYKNLFLYTKMRNVTGIAQTEAQKSSDMFAKCQYMDELTGGKGITFATGTPISNSRATR